MVKLKLVIALPIICSLLLINSCVDVPLEFTLQDKLELSEETVKEITDKIKEEFFSRISFAHPVGSPHTINPEECKTAFGLWLRNQFAQGYLPKKIILPSEYAESSRNPLIYQCRSIDISKEFEMTSEQVMGEEMGDVILFGGMKKLRDDLRENKCYENFIDPARGKLEVAAMNIEVKKNTLNISALSYTIYTSDKEITPDIIKAKPAADLVKDGTYQILAHTKPIPPEFVGSFPIDLSQKKYDKSITPLITLEGGAVAYPRIFSGKPETIKMSGQTYYVVPKGGILAFVRLTYLLKTSLRDAHCLYYQFIDEIKEEERERLQERK
jgi:hypothetical protein